MPTSTVEHLVSTGGYAPLTELNRRNAKALDSGFRQEDRMVRVAWQAHGEGVCWRSPGISSLRRNTGDGYLPDAAGRLPELDRIVGVRAADTPGRQDYNWLLSVKSQNCHGSARQKIFVEIEDLAGVCDTTGLVAAVVLQGTHIDRRYVAALKRKGHIHMVVVLTEDELARGELAPALVSMARQREIFARKLGPRGGLSRRWWTTERAFAYLDRRAVRRTTARATRGMLVPA